MYNPAIKTSLSPEVRTHGALRALVSALLLVSIGVPASWAQTASKPATASPDSAPASLEDEKTVKLETLVVKGYRESLKSSLEAERAANTIKNVITADALGNL